MRFSTFWIDWDILVFQSKKLEKWRSVALKTVVHLLEKPNESVPFVKQPSLGVNNQHSTKISKWHHSSIHTDQYYIILSSNITIPHRKNSIKSLNFYSNDHFYHHPASNLTSKCSNFTKETSLECFPVDRIIFYPEKLEKSRENDKQFFFAQKVRLDKKIKSQVVSSRLDRFFPGKAGGKVSENFFMLCSKSVSRDSESIETYLFFSPKNLG